MAKFLTTAGNSYHIEQIIINAKESLTLVTPYLRLSKNLFERITDADKRGVKTTLIYGKSELANGEKKKLDSLNNIEVFYFENLHAKCYHNETTMIISSMNLYEFSEKNNREMGILIDSNEDESIFCDGLNEIESIKNSSVLEKSIKIKVEPELKSDTSNNISDKISNEELLILPEGETDFSDTDIFIKNLHKRLEIKHPDKDFTFTNYAYGSDDIVVDNFLLDDSKVEIGSKIKLYLDNDLRYKNFKNHMREFKDVFPECFVKFHKTSYIRIDILDLDTYESSRAGLMGKIGKALFILDAIPKRITEFEAKFSPPQY